MATVFLPLTFVTGFFGQDFRWLAGDIATPAAFLVYGIGGLIVPLALLTIWGPGAGRAPFPAQPGS